MQKLFTATQIRAWDNYTITNEPVSSLNLMERASNAFVNWFVQQYTTTQQIYIFCGPGNNGGDGLAISRLLQNKKYQVTPYLINAKNKLSEDCATNLNKLTKVIQLNSITETKFPEIKKNDIIIDALFGSGLSRALTSIYASLVQQLNLYDCIKIAIDVPSGMYCDSLNNNDNNIVKTNTIVTFQIPKRSFFLTENKTHFDTVTVLDIGLSAAYNLNTDCNWYYIESKTEIPCFNNFPTVFYTPETFSKHFNIKFNSIKVIDILLKMAIEQQKIFCIKSDYNYIMTPKNSVYFILN